MTEEDLKRLECEKKIDLVLNEMRKLEKIVNVDLVSGFETMMMAVERSNNWMEQEKNLIVVEQYLTIKKIYCEYGCEKSDCEFYGGIKV